ncbi:PTH2-domain-containing protein [Obba rivulosa]|uniref:peptidyl-tRNA hydrolase n=1 Tax=Obba rivulosa TaxID=1052685 RepID=A0A8E2DVU4_9APHY|nr:PTH2-domain-containing protein [Obba rivulosa]
MPSLTTSEIITATALVATSLGIGYAIGVNSASSRHTGPVQPPSSQGTTASTSKAAVEDVDSEEEEEAAADGDLSAVKPGFMEQCKLVLVVRTDLGMTTGKIAAQCGHATLACYKALSKTNPQLLQHWERTGQAKIALKASSEDELLELEAMAKSLNLCARSILDAGRTQIAAGSRTVLGIGPAPVELINRVTGKLKLL